MNVRVAIRTILTYIGENGFYMAIDAFHFFMHAPQRIVGRVVIEFRHRTNGSPGRRRVAVFARDGERAMRAFRVGFLR